MTLLGACALGESVQQHGGPPRPPPAGAGQKHIGLIEDQQQGCRPKPTHKEARERPGGGTGQVSSGRARDVEDGAYDVLTACRPTGRATQW